MVQTDIKLTIDPEIVRKLRSENSRLWSAAHDDGSKNRIDGDAILEDAGYGLALGLLTAARMWIRKKYRDRGKTQDDFAAEKEAAKINRTSGALEEMLLEYIEAAQEGVTDPELLDELINTLDEMHGYRQSGKLIVPGKQELSEIRKSIELYTTGKKGADSLLHAPDRETPEADEFLRIMDLLAGQREQVNKNHV